MNWDAFFQVVSVGPIIGSSILGLFVGAFYGYELNSEAPTRFPLQLFTVGLASIVFVAVWAALDQSDPFTPEFQYARATLWAITCLTIPLGRWARIRFDLWRVRRKRG